MATLESKTASPARPRLPFLFSDNPGFTFVELMIILVMAALVAAVVLPRIDFTGWRLNAAVSEVAGLVRAARGTAIRQQHDVILRFHAASSTIEIHENRDSDSQGAVSPDERVYRRHLPEAIVFGPRDAPVLNGRRGYPVSFRDRTLVFHANGAASESGVIYIVADPSTHQRRDMRALWIDRATGFVQALRWQDGQWKPF